MTRKAWEVNKKATMITKNQPVGAVVQPVDPYELE